jgi:hypothetical protein
VFGFRSGAFGRALFASTFAAATGAAGNFTVVRLTLANEYQPNQPQASVDHDGVQTNGFTPAVITKCPGQLITLNWNSTLPGMPHDAVISISPLVPRSNPLAHQLPDHQALNIDLSNPATFFFWSAGPVPAMVPFFPFSIQFPAPPGPITLCRCSS